MTRVPMGASMADGKFGYPFGPKVGARYADQGGLVPQGISAELIADKWSISREDMDTLRRPEPAAGGAGHRRGPLRARDPAGARRRRGDGHRSTRACARPRWSRSAKLKPSFRPEEEGGRVTAGNSSQITDGSSALLIMSEEKAAAARVHAAGPFRRLRPRRRRPPPDADGADPGHGQGARAARA